MSDGDKTMRSIGARACGSNGICIYQFSLHSLGLLDNEACISWLDQYIGDHEMMTENTRQRNIGIESSQVELCAHTSQ